MMLSTLLRGLFTINVLRNNIGWVSTNLNERCIIYLLSKCTINLIIYSKDEEERMKERKERKLITKQRGIYCEYPHTYRVYIIVYVCYFSFLFAFV